jgi:hypothetical protein
VKTGRPGSADWSNALHGARSLLKPTPIPRRLRFISRVRFHFESSLLLPVSEPPRHRREFPKSSASIPSTLPPAWKRRFNTSYPSKECLSATWENAVDSASSGTEIRVDVLLKPCAGSVRLACFNSSAMALPKICDSPCAIAIASSRTSTTSVPRAAERFHNALSF